jgi:hypothetical protein
LYCPKIEPTSGEEHVLSIALGNWFWVIPPNVVCARCNNGVLSTLDTRLQTHPLVATVRTLAGIAGRDGQPATAGASNMRLKRNERNALHVEADHERYVSRDHDTVLMTPKWVNFGPPQRRATARALLKVALGTIWLACGPTEASAPRHDHLRDAIHGRGDVPLQYGFDNSTLPAHALQIMTVSHDSTPGLRVSLDYFGVHLWTQTAGYPDEATAAFVSTEIDVEFEDVHHSGKSSASGREGAPAT